MQDRAVSVGALISGHLPGAVSRCEIAARFSPDASAGFLLSFAVSRKLLVPPSSVNILSGF